MITAFGAKNIFSFKEGFEINFRLGNNCPNDISNDKNLANLLAIKGANASGKTNVLKALTFLGFFSLHSFTKLSPTSIIPLSSYFNSKESSDLYIEFLDDNNTLYKYEVELTNKKIFKETLSINNKIAFIRDNETINIKNTTFKDLKGIKLRNNASIISTAHQHTLNSIECFYNLFNKIISNVDSSGLNSNFISYTSVSQLYHDNPQLLKFVKNVLSKIDTGISDIIIETDEDPETKEIRYFPLFKFNINEEINYLTYHEQSSGTKALFTQLGAYKAVLNDGGILILDEFDTNLHPDLLPVLVNFFDSKLINKNNAQLIFSTHHIEIMDKLKKYRVILVNKDDNESYLYRLDELEGDILRNDRPISKVYNSGKLGGKPNIENLANLDAKVLNEE